MRNGEADKTPQSEMTFSTAQLSEILGLTPRRVQQLAEDGVLVKAARGKYKAVESIQNYIQTLQDQSGRDGEIDYFKERAYHEKAKREKAELELAVMRGEIHRSEDVKGVMNDMVAAFRSRILSIPSKLAPQLVGRTDLPLIQDLLSREAHEALSELANYDPAAFYKRNADYVGLIGDDEEAD